MERLTTNTSESPGTCLTLCYQSLAGSASQMGVDSQPLVSMAQIGIDTQSVSAFTQIHLDGHGTGDVTHLGIDGQPAGVVAQLGVDGSGVSMDNQAAVAVQSLLDSQQTPETQAEEEDVFQCGRCKKQFTSLTAFFTHKQTHCLPPHAQSSQLQHHRMHLSQQEHHHHHHELQNQQQHNQHQSLQQQTLQSMQPLTPVQQVQGGGMRSVLQNGIGHTGAGAFTPSICTVTQPLATYTTIPTSPLSQLPQGMVLADELVTLTSLDHSTLQGSTIQMMTAPYNPRSTGSVTILSTVQPTATLATGGATTYTQHHSNNHLASFAPQNMNSSSQFSSFPAQANISGTLASFTQQSLQTVSLPQQSLQTVSIPQQTQQITITIPDKPSQPTILRRTPTKAGRKSSQSQATGVGVVVAENLVEVGTTRRGSKASGSTGLEEKRRMLQCQYCNKLFSKNFDLQQHVRAHTGEKPFQCIVCGRAFAQKSNVKKHMVTHKVWPSGNSATLPKQPPPFPVVEGEDNSTLAGEGDGMVVTVSETQSLLKEEASSDKAKTSLQSGIENGQVKVRVMIDNSYICQYCSTHFKTFFQLKTHMVKHKSEQVYKCVMKSCGASFQELDAFLDHTKTHENEMTYRCHQCNKYFLSLYELGVHQYTHSLYPSQGLKSGPRHFQCTKCGNKYTTPEALEHHVTTTTHQYPCPHCCKVFTCERFLRRHLPIHGSEGQFECQTCNKRFKTEHYLKSHMLIHTGETPYQCETCNAAFNRKDKLKRHMTIHEAIKKYRCPFKSLTGCTKEFNRPDKLKSHIITHSGIKPFKCSVCGKGFSRRPHLMEHERGHNSDYRFKCEKCGKGFFRAKLYNEHKCQPGKGGMEPQLFRPRNRRKIGRPRKRLVPMSALESSQGQVASENGCASSRKPGLRSASGIHYRNARVAAAIANQQRGALRAKNAAIAADRYSEERDDSYKEDQQVHHGEAINVMDMAVITDKQPAHHGEAIGVMDMAVITDKQQVHHGEAINVMDMTVITDKQQVSLAGELEGGQVIDHYVVHLTECSEGGVSTLHTTLSPAALQAGLAAGTLQPITIIEATNVHVSGPGGATSMVDATGLPLVGMTRGGKMMATQVVVASSSPGSQQQTYMTCPAQLVDFSSGDPVLQGTENLLKASAEILQTAEVETHH